MGDMGMSNKVYIVVVDAMPFNEVAFRGTHEECVAYIEAAESKGAPFAQDMWVGEDLGELVPITGSIMLDEVCS
jgi:hypothetical protein